MRVPFCLPGSLPLGMGAGETAYIVWIAGVNGGEKNMPECGKYFEGEEYIDILFHRFRGLEEQLSGLRDYCVTVINARWAILHVNQSEFAGVSYGSLGYTTFPLVYGVQDYNAMNAAGITQAREQPFLSLRGSGTLVGIVDTGIRYDHEAFVSEDGTSRIEVLWDQTGKEEEEADRLPGYNGNPEAEQLAPYGVVYTRNRLNEALSVKASGGDPQEIVPVTDVEEGHGTFLAGIAAGRANPQQGFTGAAPDSGLVVVKLKQSKRYLKEFYLVNDGALCYSETDILMGVRFVNEYAQLVNKPVSIILGLGTNLTAHIGSTILSDYLNDVGQEFGRCVSVCTGNYANKRLHYKGRLMPEEEYVSVELRVGEGERGFWCGLWSAPPEVFSLGFVSPLGRVEQRVPPRISEETTLRFILEGTQIQVYYGINQAISGQNYAIMRFIDPSPGIWTIRVYGDNVLSGNFNIWLTNQEFLWSDTYFLQSDPYETITDPGNSMVPISVGAYDYRDGSIYIGSGRGTGAAGGIKPDIVAPGVNILGPSRTMDQGYVLKTGTSIAAAITGGGAALLLEYGAVRGFYPTIRTYVIKNFMIAGAVRRANIAYPDPLFGYGYLNLYQALENIRR